MFCIGKSAYFYGFKTKSRLKIRSPTMGERKNRGSYAAWIVKAVQEAIG